MVKRIISLNQGKNLIVRGRCWEASKRVAPMDIEESAEPGSVHGHPLYGLTLPSHLSSLAGLASGRLITTLNCVLTWSWKCRLEQGAAGAMLLLVYFWEGCEAVGEAPLLPAWLKGKGTLWRKKTSIHIGVPPCRRSLRHSTFSFDTRKRNKIYHWNYTVEAEGDEATLPLTHHGRVRLSNKMRFNSFRR